MRALPGSRISRGRELRAIVSRGVTQVAVAVGRSRPLVRPRLGLLFAVGSTGIFALQKMIGSQQALMPSISRPDATTLTSVPERTC